MSDGQSAVATVGTRWAYVIAAVAALTLLADWLFYGQPVGFAAGLYLLVVVAVLLVLGGRGLCGRRTWWVVLALCGLAIAMVIEPTGIALTLGVLGVATLAIMRRRGTIDRTGRWLLQVAHLAVVGPFVWVRDTRVMRAWQRRQGDSAGTPAKAGRLVLAWGLPMALSLVFVLLFALANPVIERWLEQGAELLSGEAMDWLPGPGRVVFWLIVAAVFYGLLRWRARLPAIAEAEADWLPDGPGDQLDGAVVARFTVRCLVVFNVVFAVQTVLDGWYLIGGAALPEGMTYAQYAHRGAYPLVVTALLAGAFVLALFQPGRDGGDWRQAKRLVYLWLVQNVFLVGTAAWRLALYVDIYSLTRLRVAAGIWMGLVALGLVWIGVRIYQRRSNTWLINANTLTLLAVLYACAFVNIDGYIASFNVRHCQEVSGRSEAAALDVQYLYRLGPEALPAARWAVDELDDDEATRSELVELIEWREARLAQRLATDWRAWTWRRWWLLAR